MTEDNPSTLALLGFLAIVISLVLLIIAYKSAKNKKYKQHKWYMGAAATTNTLFLIFYISRLITEGNTEFTGPNFVFKFIYIPILVIHIATAFASIFFVGRQLYGGFFKAKYQGDGVPYFEELERDNHRTQGKLAVKIWFFSFFGGITIFGLLYIV